MWVTRTLHKGKIFSSSRLPNPSQTELTATLAFLQWAGQTSAGAAGGGWGDRGRGVSPSNWFSAQVFVESDFSSSPPQPSFSALAHHCGDSEEQDMNRRKFIHVMMKKLSDPSTNKIQN